MGVRPCDCGKCRACKRRVKYKKGCRNSYMLKYHRMWHSRFKIKDIRLFGPQLRMTPWSDMFKLAVGKIND